MNDPLLTLVALAPFLALLVALRHGPWRVVGPGGRQAFRWALIGGLTASLAAAAAVPTLRALLLSGPQEPEARALLRAFLGAAAPEETIKLGVLLACTLFARRRAPHLSPLALGAAIGLAFASVENAVYVQTDGAHVLLLRCCTALPCHAFLGAIMGHYAEVASSSAADGRRAATWSWAKCWGLPVLLHGLYDWPLLAEQGQSPRLDEPGGLSMTLLVLGLLAAWTRFVVIDLERRQGAAAPSASPPPRAKARRPRQQELPRPSPP